MQYRSLPYRTAPSRRLATSLLSVLLASVALSANADIELESLPVSIDSAHVIVGETTFQILKEGSIVGTSVIDTRLDRDALVIHSVSTVEPDIVEDAEIRLDRATFAPLGTEIRGRFSGTRIEADFRFGDLRLTGRATRYPANGGESSELPVDMPVPAGTFLRGSAIALLPAMPLATGQSFQLHWFNPMKTILARITLQVTGIERVTVPAGTFESYRIEQQGDAPAMIFHVTTEAPRRVVRAEVVGEPTILQLMP